MIMADRLYVGFHLFFLSMNRRRRIDTNTSGLRKQYQLRTGAELILICTTGSPE